MLAGILHQLATECCSPLIALTGSSTTRGEVIMHPRQAENVLSARTACERITRNSAVLEQVSGNPLSQRKGPDTARQVAAKRQEASRLPISAQGKAGGREGRKRRGN